MQTRAFNALYQKKMLSEQPPEFLNRSRNQQLTFLSELQRLHLQGLLHFGLRSIPTALTKNRVSVQAKRTRRATEDCGQTVPMQHAAPFPENRFPKLACLARGARA